MGTVSRAPARAGSTATTAAKARPNSTATMPRSLIMRLRGRHSWPVHRSTPPCSWMRAGAAQRRSCASAWHRLPASRQRSASALRAHRNARAAAIGCKPDARRAAALVAARLSSRPPRNLCRMARPRADRISREVEDQMSIIAWLVLGAIAGYLAGFLVKGDEGLGVIGHIVLGIVGALVGGFLAGALLGIGPHRRGARSQLDRGRHRRRHHRRARRVAGHSEHTCGSRSDLIAYSAASMGACRPPTTGAHPCLEASMSTLPRRRSMSWRLSRAVYNQWTQFETFPLFMGGVERVVQVDDRTLDWTASIAGQSRSWRARITEQLPDRIIAWESIDGARNAGSVHFQAVSADVTLVDAGARQSSHEGPIEAAGDVARPRARDRSRSDLERFKTFIEAPRPRDRRLAGRRRWSHRRHTAQAIVIDPKQGPFPTLRGGRNVRPDVQERPARRGAPCQGSPASAG